jgi:ATP-dependent Clp protease ATP-binding subunit ClpC
VFERFSERAKSVLMLAQDESLLLNHSVIGTEHLLLGLLREGEGVAANALTGLGVSAEAVREQVELVLPVPGRPPENGSRPFTPRAKKVLELSLREALQLGHNYIGTEHLLLGLVREGEGAAIQVLESLGFERARLRQEIMQLLSGHRSEGAPEGESIDAPLSMEPRCNGCTAELSEVAQYRSVRMPAASAGSSPLTVEVVSCRRCGFVLGMFRSG